jgi:hypothetical protein
VKKRIRDRKSQPGTNRTLVKRGGFAVALSSIIVAHSATSHARGLGSVTTQPSNPNNGPVLAHVKIVSLFWGPNVNSTVTSKIDGFYQAAVVDTPFLDWLSEYNTPTQSIGRGSRSGPSITFTPANQSTTLSDADIAAELAFQINTNPSIPAPDTNTLYALAFPPGITIIGPGGTMQLCKAPPPPSETPCAYHANSLQTIHGQSQTIWYSIMPDFSTGGCSGGCGLQTMFDNFTTVASHELVEAITDPNSTPGSSNPGWQPEIADPCEPRTQRLADDATAPIVGAHGVQYSVQRAWSKMRSSCIFSGDLITAPPALVGYADPVHGTNHVIYRAPFSGVIEDLVYTASTHSWAAQVIGGPEIGTPAAAYFDGTSGHAFSVFTTSTPGSSGLVHVAELAGTTLPNTMTDLIVASRSSAQAQGASATRYTTWNGATPLAPGNPSSLSGFSAAGVNHVFYAGTDSAIHEIYNNGMWFERPLGGAAANATPPDSITSGWDGSVEHVFYTGLGNGHLEELYSNGTWFPNDWTTVQGGQGTATGQISMSVDSGVLTVWGTNNLTQSPAIHSISHAPSGWTNLTYTSPSGGGPQFSPTLAFDANGQGQAFYVGADQQIYQLKSDGSTAPIIPSSATSSCDTTRNPAMFVAKSYVSGSLSPIAGFWDGVAGLRRVYFIDLAGYIVELTASLTATTWTVNNVSCLVGGHSVRTVPYSVL